MSTAANAQRKPQEDSKPPAKPRPISRDRAMGAEFVTGTMLNITLEGTDRIEEGVQDVGRFELVASRLGVNQWLQVTNDAGSMFRLMRVERLHMAPGSGLRALVLRDIIPPRFFDLENEAIVATGEYYVRYGGTHRRWCVITPAGLVGFEGFNTEHEAKIAAHRESGNPRPI